MVEQRGGLAFVDPLPMADDILGVIRPAAVQQPQAAPNTPYYSAPNAPAQRPATSAAMPDDHIEQWNHQTGVW